jgi:5-amino-6-(5-phosphoribosylamino)uracil reductase
MPETPAIDRPHTTVVLAMSADGKIADVTRSPARFSSSADQAHLENQVALADAVLFGAGTLRAYNTTRSVSNRQLQQQRQQRGLPIQPVQIVCSRLAQFDPQLRFFRQNVPRWLLTTEAGAEPWRNKSDYFEQILVVNASNDGINWHDAYQQLNQLGIQRLAVLGGGDLVASLLAADLIDELWFTVCPLILGGAAAPTPVEGTGFSQQLAKRLELLAVERVDQELFLHYRLSRE